MSDWREDMQKVVLVGGPRSGVRIMDPLGSLAKAQIPVADDFAYGFYEASDPPELQGKDVVLRYIAPADARMAEKGYEEHDRLHREWLLTLGLVSHSFS